MTERSLLFGVPIDLETFPQAVEHCTALIAERRPVQHVVINAGKVVMMQDQPQLRDAVAGCEVIHADGQSIVWAGRLAGLAVPERVAGIDLMQALLGVCEESGWPVYFLGATDDVLTRFVTVVQERYPKLTIAGHRNGYFTDDAAVADAIAQSGARVLFVGISSPRKELLLRDHLAEMGRVFAMGVGGSFDVLSGMTPRAPIWMQRSGLEWFFRLIQEPRRLASRYIVGNSRFAVLAAREAVAQRTARTHTADANTKEGLG
ncbi:MAG: WecB/TagA/CpsF family glycosyltransferase [Coriobacteriia bacterium]|nr:WecB/TagA/CpsF family glycosyltransferase [Coriobacteriia bacterium]